MEFLKIFQPKFHQIIENEVKSVLLDQQENQDVDNVMPSRSPEKSTALACSYCRAQFDNVNQQREHYKLDWHRYNLRQSLQTRQPISEDEFNEKTAKDDISSISGSDSEKDDTLDMYATAQGRIFLQTHEGKVFSIYACLLYGKKLLLNDDILNSGLRHCCVTNQNWAILMLGGGHFAGAIFKGDEAIVHKTFHCYTVRAGQGRAQSSRDNKSGGSHPKSAGASLRRYNEQALNQHIKSIIEAWKSDLDKCSLIIYRASGPYNRTVLFGGTSPILDKNDSRLRTIPFSTRRATFAEVKRVHALLTQVQVYESVESAINHFERHKKPEENAKRAKSRQHCIDRARSREIVERPLPIELESDSDNSNFNLDLSLETTTVALVDNLQEFDDSLTPEQRKSLKTKHKKKPKKSKAKKEALRKSQMIDILTRGNVDKLCQLMDDYIKIETNEKTNFINEVLDDKGNTLLHLAAMNEHSETVEFLLNNDANPCIKNENHHTAYSSTTSREIRDIFKEYARANPDKYNYNKAQIPTNVLTVEELSEKKKAQRKIKKEKEKIRKQENAIKKQEEKEKERFLQLSDREKRALAAEKRILNQSGNVISRCFLCGADMAGKVPFEYLNNRFCSVDCLKGHRMQNPTILS